MELKSPSKVKALAWLVAHGKVNTNDKLQLRRPYKALCPQWCILCKGNGESINHLFLHCPVTIGLWHRLFNLVGVIWVPPRSIEDMLVISFRGLVNSVRGKILWQIACLTLISMVWQERNNRIFEDKGRTEEVVWDLIRFYSSLWASCTEAFRGVPLSILQINWIGEGPLILPLSVLQKEAAGLSNLQGPIEEAKGDSRPFVLSLEDGPEGAEGAFEVSSYPFSFLFLFNLIVILCLLRLLPTLRSSCCLISTSTGSSKVCSSPKGVVSLIVKPNQELEGISFLGVSQTNPSGASSPVRRLSRVLGPT
ncbi:hypothetical protein CK203_043124 [Vitis vinifera]|uniref:Reverse transcriptase zinc-binding domain-containing protein n=1 Tax=Vitis vinifera TaxID=29760 RepID=A0A438H2M7_VITVI|nr:hypothetical protein CK203_043124 [Vitis vinifera]